MILEPLNDALYLTLLVQGGKLKADRFWDSAIDLAPFYCPRFVGRLECITDSAVLTYSNHHAVIMATDTSAYLVVAFNQIKKTFDFRVPGFTGRAFRVSKRHLNNHKLVCGDRGFTGAYSMQWEWQPQKV